MSIGFKEWTLICDALGRGEQSLIIRKGGIHEGRAGFRFQYEEFFLFPTLFHEQVAKLKLPADTALPSATPGEIVIRQFARVEWTETVTDLAIVEKLAPFHLWRDEQIAERFHYGQEGEPPAVHVAFLRVFNLATPWVFPDSPKYGGCRSWINLPDPAPTERSPTLSEAEHTARAETVRALIS